MNRHVRRALIALFWIGLWQALSMIVGLPKLLPGPVETARAWAALAGTGKFWLSVGMTMLRVAAGYLCAVAAGVLLAALCWRIRGLEELLSPLRSVIKATPVASIIILVYLWIAKTRVPVFISFLMVLPIVWTGVQEALGNVDGQLKEMCRAYRFSRKKTVRYLYIPAVQPAFRAACVTGLGFAWKSGIAAEVIATPDLSVGKYLNDAKVYMEAADLFAWTLTVVLLSMALEGMLKSLMRGREEKK